MKTPVYIRCPRCELNYIKKRDKYCEVCKQEMKISTNNLLDIDDEAELEICPICKANYIQEDEIMCASCAKEKALEDGMFNEGESDSDWTSYYDDEDAILDNDDELGEMVSITDGDEDSDDSELDEDESLLDDDDEDFDLEDFDYDDFDDED